MEYISIIIIILFLFYILKIYDLLSCVKFQFSTSFNNVSYKSIPTTKKQISTIKDYLKKYKTTEYIFIDFGSGIGSTLISFQNKFKMLIGVEIEENSYKKSLEKTKHFNNINVINEDIQNFVFPNDKIIFYLYEPLFLMNKTESIKIYNVVFENLVKTYEKNKKDVLVIYLTGYSRKDLDTNFFKSYRLRVDKKGINGFYPYRYIYFLKFDK